jgi:hypothetical protein
VNQEVIRMRVGLESSSEAVSDVNPLAFSRHHTGIVGTAPTREPTGEGPIFNVCQSEDAKIP